MISEQLGEFYLGRRYDLETARADPDQPVLYPSKDLVTHAVCIGMTGSGKTGLCIGLIEEAAIDGIPAIIIDPKGDLANLLLTFPQLRAGDFAPWVNPDDARRKGLSLDDFAKEQSELWTKGLASWHQDGARIQRLRDSADFTVYTPGSNSGVPVSVLKSFDAPTGPTDPDSYRDRISATATGLLGLIGIDADPVRSREHILLSTLLDAAWSAGCSLDLPTIIQQVQSPPIARIGVMELESFYTSNERFTLATRLNSLLASPGFSAWLEGEPLDPATLLYTPQGRPRVAIFSIAHLSDPERMFFVAMLLNQMLAWTRAQSGTTSLRALLYMDEIAGYCPPVASVPSKAPLLALMKQARAFGVGIVLATQNPVDLDYKGLSNAGTWFIGRLQTERDKARVLDGLEGASAAAGANFDRAAIDSALSRLGKRVFLVNNVHDDGPFLMETRWVLSYLRGPLTRDQIRVLMENRQPPPTGARPTPAPSLAPPPAQRPVADAESSPQPAQQPLLPPTITQYFIRPSRARPAGATLLYRPALLGMAGVVFTDAKAKVDEEHDIVWTTAFSSGPVAIDWREHEESALTTDDLGPSPEPGATFEPLHPDAAKPKAYDAWRRDFVDTLGRSATLELLRSPAMKLTSSVGETEPQFRARLHHAVHEQRDAAADALRAKYAPRFTTLQDRLRRAQQAVDVQKAQARDAKVSTAVSFGSAVLGAVLGRKTLSAGNISKAGTAARGVSRTARESADVDRAVENVDSVRARITELEQQFQDDLDTIHAAVDPHTEPLEQLTIRPKKTGIKVRILTLAWIPHWVEPNGAVTLAR